MKYSLVKYLIFNDNEQKLINISASMMPAYGGSPVWQADKLYEAGKNKSAYMD